MTQCLTLRTPARAGVIHSLAMEEAQIYTQDSLLTLRRTASSS